LQVKHPAHDRDLVARSVRFFLKCSSRSVELSAGRAERDKERSRQILLKRCSGFSQIAGSDKEAAFGFDLARAVIGIGGPPIFRSGRLKDSLAGGSSGEFCLPSSVNVLREAWREREAGSSEQ
jgi:hypothetical protein